MLKLLTEKNAFTFASCSVSLARTEFEMKLLSFAVKNFCVKNKKQFKRTLFSTSIHNPLQQAVCTRVSNARNWITSEFMNSLACGISSCEQMPHVLWSNKFSSNSLLSLNYSKRLFMISSSPRPACHVVSRSGFLWGGGESGSISRNTPRSIVNSTNCCPVWDLVNEKIRRNAKNREDCKIQKKITIWQNHTKSLSLWSWIFVR